jgi:cardiolipin synthase
MSDPSGPAAGDRIATLPNLLSALRLAGAPLFLWLILGPERDGLALLVLMFSGFTDWADGWLARKLNQGSRLGQLLDPAADRLYILFTLIGLTGRDIIPLWLTVLLISRDVMLLACVPRLKKLGFGPALPVHYLGKAATFNLLYAFPFLLLSDGTGEMTGTQTMAAVFGWAFAIWGTALYWWAGILYVKQVRDLRPALDESAPAVDLGTGPTART